MQFLDGASLFAQEAASIEANPADVSEEMRVRHRAFVSAAVMQAVAALESEASEILIHGPGHHLGSNGVDLAARDFLAPVADMVDSLPVLERFEKVLHLTRKPVMDRGAGPYQNMALVVKLRNEITHFKSLWGSELDRQKLVHQLRDKHFARPPFVSEHSLFFPHQVLGSACATWSVTSAVAFLTDFYEKLGFPCRMARFKK